MSGIPNRRYPAFTPVPLFGLFSGTKRNNSDIFRKSLLDMRKWYVKDMVKSEIIVYFLIFIC